MSIHPDTQSYNSTLAVAYKLIGDSLAHLISAKLPEAENKIWHRHPVWFLDGNPIVGYSQQKAGIRLMFWSGRSFDESVLIPGKGRFQDASIFFTHVDQIDESTLTRLLQKSHTIQWDYKNIVKKKGVLERIR
jgi:hypothetical protein